MSIVIPTEPSPFIMSPAPVTSDLSGRCPHLLSQATIASTWTVRA